KGLFCVHDLYHHAPTYVRKRAEREAKRIENGQTISDVRRAAVMKRWSKVHSNAIQTDTNGNHLYDDVRTHKSSFKCHTNDFPPAPAPISKARARFDSFWSAYPRKRAKGAALKAWSKLNPDDSLLADILRALSWQSSTSQWRESNGKYVPYPATWLNGQR